MGDPKKQKKKYGSKKKPWESSIIENERNIMKQYGLKNKQEILKISSILSGFKRQAKRLVIESSEQIKKEKKQLLTKLQRLDLLKEGAGLDDVLELKLSDLLERRLQTLIFKKNLTRTIGQARQFIIHGHITVNNKTLTVPSYLVLKTDKIGFDAGSSLSREDHPERVKKEIEKTKIIKKEEKPKEEIKKENV